jgi:hypothetical protein
MEFDSEYETFVILVLTGVILTLILVMVAINSPKGTTCEEIRPAVCWSEYGGGIDGNSPTHYPCRQCVGS